MVQASWKYKLMMFCLFSLAYTVFYILPNFHPGFHSSYLPLLPVDMTTPLIPWTFLIYISDYLLTFVVICLLEDAESFKSYCRLCFGVLIVCGLFFLFFPTRYPRPDYPEVSNALVSWAMNLVRTLDTPNNCFPSMHVAVTTISAWCVRNRRPAVIWTFVMWSIAIYVSTLTTKQHYFVDIIGGLTVASVVALLEWVLFEKGYLRMWIAKKYAIDKTQPRF